MAEPNIQELVSGVLISVTLISSKSEASIVMKFREKVGHPRHVSIEHYLKAGISERDALKEVLNTAKNVIQSAADAGVIPG